MVSPFDFQAGAAVYLQKKRAMPLRQGAEITRVALSARQRGKRKRQRKNPETFLNEKFRVLLVEIRGFEPLTYALRTNRSTN